MVYLFNNKIFILQMCGAMRINVGGSYGVDSGESYGVWGIDVVI